MIRRNDVLAVMYRQPVDVSLVARDVWKLLGSPSGEAARVKELLYDEVLRGTLSFATLRSHGAFINEERVHGARGAR